MPHANVQDAGNGPGFGPAKDSVLRKGGAFELDRVSVKRGKRRLLDRVSISVAAGEAIAIVGPSGAGKTTLLRLLAAHIRPDEGHLELGGHSADSLAGTELRRVRASAGFVHQDLRLIDNLRVSQNVLFGALGRRSAWAAVRDFLAPSGAELEKVHALLERVGIGDLLFQRVDTLSGGERQRVALARALFQDPTTILADEPVASLDPGHARNVVELLMGLGRERGLTVVLSLHDLDLAREFAPRVIGLRGGRVQFDNAPSSISEQQFKGLFALTDAPRGEGP